MRTKSWVVVLVASAALALLAWGQVFAQQPAVITVNLTTQQEVPAVKAETPTSAAGRGAVVISLDRTEVAYAVTWFGTSGNVMAAHFHRAAAGSPGPVVQTICGGPAPAISGPCPTGTSGTVAGVWKIPQNLLQELLQGNLYINMHTQLNPAGEIRGQVRP